LAPKKSELQNAIVSKFEDVFYWHLEVGSKNPELFCSENILAVTGYASDLFKEIKDKTTELIFKDDQPGYKKAMDLFNNDPGRNKLSLEYRMKRKDGRIIWVNELMKVERNEKGEITEYFGKVRDITSDKEINSGLQEKIDELEEMNNSKDNFISVLSHDLRAPFTSILGFSEILLNETSLSDKEKSEYLTYINDSSLNQLQLINYLLDWSRLQTKRMKIERLRLHTQSIVFNCVSSLTGSAVRKNINIKVNVPDNIYLEADERLISIVVTNLLNNAIKFSREGDSVEISANYFSDNFIEFIIVDEGIGIPETSKEKIFHISKIFSTPGTKGEKGTGLGLALAKQIIQKHEGDIWFYSTEGVGSEFHFTVPASANTILIVKENKEDRARLERNLLRIYDDIQIVTASNGFEALQFVEKSSPTLIITDHDLPLMNGLKFAESIKKMNKVASIPVIALLNEEAFEFGNHYEELGIKTLNAETLDDNGLLENIKSYLL
jgi:PAS domain S-box-containing protein